MSISTIQEKAGEEAIRLWESAGAPVCKKPRLTERLMAYNASLASIPPQQWNNGITREAIGMDPLADFVSHGELVLCGFLEGGRACNLALVSRAMMWELIWLSCGGCVETYRAAVILEYCWPQERGEWQPLMAEIAAERMRAVPLGGNGRAKEAAVHQLTPAFAGA